VLHALTAAKAEVAEAAGDPAGLLAAIDRLNALFSRVTGGSAQRRAGQMYAGRSLVYEDTVRDIEVSLGRPLLQAIAGPLELLLTSARWFAAEVADAYERRFHEAYGRLSARMRGERVPLGRLVSAVTPDLIFAFNRLPPLVEACTAELRRKWSAILDVPAGVRRHELTSGGIRERVLREFAAPAPRWAGALRHAPDIMIAAAGPQAVAAGDFQLVLGELHVCANTLEARVFLAQADDPDWLRKAEAADLAGRRVVSLQSTQSRGVNSRTFPSALYGPEFTYWTMFSDVDETHWPLPAAALEVEDRAGRLTVVSTVDGREFDLVEILGEQLGWAAMNGFSPVGSAAHVPRILVDRMVIARESWRFAPADLTWAALDDGSRRFLAARRWRLDNGLPERCFYTVPTEMKPQYVDFSSVLLVDIFARGIRNGQAGEPGATVNVSEMLPDIHQSWLTDHLGRQYTSELRMVAVDRTGSEAL
jgi:hypothetical protein